MEARADRYNEIYKFKDSPFTEAFFAVGNARRTLEAGFTTVRDVGSKPFLAVDLRNSIAEGFTVGPRIVASGPGISITGGHVIDTERIFSYRALRISRGDKTPIEGFEQDDYVRNASFERRSVADLLAEFETVRRATVFLFRSLDAQAWSRRGIASQNEVTVRALAYIIAGHELHHMEVLRQKYLPALKASR